MNVNKGEPPSSSRSKSSPYLVGKNSHGDWVVRDQSGLRGGLFVNRAEALKFAMFENGHRPQAVIMVPGTLELDFATNESAVRRAPAEAAMSLHRHAA
jgi:hypothetical protein